jgi:hypothetical protein
MDQEVANLPDIVIPAEAGIHLAASRRSTMDPGFRREYGCGSGEGGGAARMPPA